MRNYIKNVVLYYKGNYNKIARHISKRLPIQEIACQEPFVCMGDELYPESLYSLENPPYILFYRGNINLLRTACISIVGSRRPSEYSLEETRKLVHRTRTRYTIVSGLARGIDICAHLHAYNTIAVVASGLDLCYPPEHTAYCQALMKHHLVISEYPMGVWIQKTHFPFRNRIIACLGEVLFVMSAQERSGTMHTVNQALQLNKEIICLPHNINDEAGKGCNLLIQEGATVLTNTD